MPDQPHARGDAGAFEDDFEWVNAWATSMPPAPPAAAPAGGHGAADARTETPSHDRARAERATPADKAPAGKVDRVARRADPAPSAARDAGSHAARAPDGDDIIATLAGEAVPIALGAWWPGRWTSLFRLASRASSPEADAARELFVLDGPGAPATLTDTGGKPRNTAAADDADQLTRDIAEITRRRDQLLGMPVRSASQATPSRTSNCVRIVVGAVLAFTSLIVLGAAASFVSLR